MRESSLTETHRDSWVAASYLNTKEDVR